MSSNEIIDVLNEDGEVIDTISREKAERDNHIIENVLVFVFTPFGKVWVQLRPQAKKYYPGKWDISACGGVLSGESHAHAAARETLEEMGIEIELQYIETFLNVFPSDDDKEIKRLSHLYIGISDEQPEVNEDVDEFRDLQPSQLRLDVEKRPDAYVPSFIVELDKATEAYAERMSRSPR